jgi:hypothetical protein
MGIERRTAERVFVKIPVILDAGTGVTRDANSTGVYIESEAECTPGGELNFSLKFENPGCPMMVWNCKGRVVRVERHGGRQGIAAQIVEFSLQAAPRAGQRAAASA